MFKFFILISLFLLSTNISANHLTVGYSNEAMQKFSAKDVAIATNVWLQQLVKDSNHTATFSFYTDKGLAKAAKEGKVKYLSAYGIAYVKYFDLSKLQDGFSGGSKNRSDENLILVLQKGKTIQDFLAMEHPRIAYLAGNELATIYAKYLFLKNNKYTKITFAPKRTNYKALLDLFFHKVDATIIMKKTFRYATELNPQIANALYIAQTTNYYAGNFGFFTQNVDPNFVHEIKSLGLNLNRTNKGKQILDMFRTDAVIETKLSDLKPIEKLYHDYLKLKKKEKLQQ